MGYWIPTVRYDGKVERVYCASLKDAFNDASKTLLGVYRVHGLKALTMKNSLDHGVPIFNTKTGQSYNHWVRFANGSNPKDGFEEVTDDKRFGVSYKTKNFPKSWL